jgi:hypothetical protein
MEIALRRREAIFRYSYRFALKLKAPMPIEGEWLAVGLSFGFCGCFADAARKPAAWSIPKIPTALTASRSR